MANMAGEISARHMVKFDGKNFQGWKFQVRAVLLAHDLVSVVDGSRTMPADPQGSTGKAWIKDNAKAMYVMSSAMEPEQLECILMCNTAKEMWDRLTSIHEQRSEIVMGTID